MKNDKEIPDILPNGKDDQRYLNEGAEWPNLENRLGKPRIWSNHFIYEALEWAKQFSNPDNFSYFEAGCGHGNDLRAIKEKLKGRGRFLGIDISLMEIIHGLEFYEQRDNEDTKEAQKMFALGNLHDLSEVSAWDHEKSNFSYPKKIGDNQFDLVYMEAVIHGAGYGYDTYQEKKASAQQILKELARVCKKGGKFLGRITAFSPIVSKEEQFSILRNSNNWRFVPDLDEFIAMLRIAGFDNINRVVRPTEKAEIDPNQRNMIKINFLAEKAKK